MKVDSDTTNITVSSKSPQALELLTYVNASFTGDVGVVAVLKFSSLQRNDNGTYFCQATNSLSQTGTFTAFSHEISLKVLGK